MLIFALAFVPAALNDLLTLIGGSSSSGGATISATTFALAISLFFSWMPVGVLAYILGRNGESRATIGLGSPRWTDLPIGLGLFFASYIVVLVLSVVFQVFGEKNVEYLPSGLPTWYLVGAALAIALTAGITEEVVVRGYGQTRLDQLRAPAWVIVLLPTALWGSLHIYEGLGSAMTIFCLGLVYALWFLRTRRLLPVIIAHASFDLAQLLLAVFVYHNI